LLPKQDCFPISGPERHHLVTSTGKPAPEAFSEAPFFDEANIFLAICTFAKPLADAPPGQPRRKKAAIYQQLKIFLRKT
jgi:hypothetical protein